MGNRKQDEARAVEASRGYSDDTRQGPRDNAAKLRPAVVAELETYFACSDSVFGLSSKFDGLVQLAMSGGAHSGRNVTEDATIQRVAPSDRNDRPVEGRVGVHRAVLAALRQIGEPHRTVLWAAHADGVPPPEVKVAFGIVGRVALMTKAIAKRFAESRRKEELIEAWLIRACKSPDGVKAIKDEAETMLAAAHAAYSAAREPEEGSKGIGAFKRSERRKREPIARKSVGDAFPAPPAGWRT
jgi:hypothetical protein